MPLKGHGFWFDNYIFTSAEDVKEYFAPQFKKIQSEVVGVIMATEGDSNQEYFNEAMGQIMERDFKLKAKQAKELENFTPDNIDRYYLTRMSLVCSIEDLNKLGNTYQSVLLKEKRSLICLIDNYAANKLRIEKEYNDYLTSNGLL